MKSNNRSKSVKCKPSHVNQHRNSAIIPGSKASVPKSKQSTAKKAKAKKEVKKILVKDKPIGQRSDKVGVDGGLKGIVQMIQENVALAATNPTNSVIPARLQGYRRILAHYIARIARDCPTTFLENLSGNTLSPKDVWIYGHVCLFSMLKKFGGFTGTDAGSLPDFDSLAVPAVLAKALQYMKPYMAEGVCLRQETTFDLSSPIPVGGTACSSADATWPLPTIVFDAMGKDANAALGGVYVRRNGIVPTPTWISWITNRLGYTIQRLNEVTKNLMVLGAQIGFAPDSSAYGCRSVRGSTTVLASYHSNHVNWELLQLYSQGTPNSQSPDVLTHPLLNGDPTPISPSATDAVWSLEDQVASTFVFLMWNSPKWKPGGILSVKYRGQKVSTLIVAYKSVGGDVFFNILCNFYNSLQTLNPEFDDNGTNAPTTPGPRALMVQLIWVALMLHHKRVDSSSPLFSLGGQIPSAPTTFFPQAFLNAGLPGVMVPPMLREYINSFGVAVYQGKMVCPIFIPQNNITPPQSRALYGMSTSNPSAYRTGFRVTFPYAFSTWTGPSPNVILGAIKYDTAFQTAYDTAYTSSCASFFPYEKTTELIASLNQLYKTIGNIVGSMVEYSDADSAFGSTGQMMAITVGLEVYTIEVSSNNVSKSDVVIPIEATASARVPTVIISAVPLNASEVVCGLSYAASTSTVDVANGPFVVQMEAANTASTFVQAAASQAATPNMFDPGTDDGGELISYGGQLVMKRANTSNEKAEKAYQSLLCQIASSAIKASPYICSGLDFGASFLPVVGSFLRGNIKSLCESGIESVITYAQSRCTMTTNESQKPKTYSGDAKSDLVALARAAGVDQGKIAQLVGAYDKYLEYHRKLLTA